MVYRRNSTSGASAQWRLLSWRSGVSEHGSTRPPDWIKRRREQRTARPTPCQQAQLRDMGTGRLRRDPGRSRHRAYLQAAGGRATRLPLDVDHHRGGSRAASAVARVLCHLDEAKTKFAETWRAWLALKSR